jgi:hypothetical protein
MNKYFTYQFDTHYKGYRLLTEKSNFAYFKNLAYSGFRIVYSNAEIIHFEIDTQLIRKLKLKKISDEINRNSKEYYLFELLERSKESGTYVSYDSYATYWYNYSDVELTSTLIEKIDRKQKAQHRSNIINQKAKQYENKSRFRK